jgi:WD40 repeat protein
MHAAGRLQWLTSRIPFTVGMTVGGNSGMRVQNLSEHIPLLTNCLQNPSSGGVKGLALNNGISLAVPGNDWSYLLVGIGKTIHVKNFTSGLHEFELGRHQGMVEVVTISADGNKVASAGRDNVTRVWDFQRRKEVAKFGPARSVKFTALRHMHLLYGVHGDYTVIDLSTKAQRSFPGYKSQCISKDGSVMVLSRHNHVNLVYTSTMTAIRSITLTDEIETHSTWYEKNTVLSDDGKYLYFWSSYKQDAAVFQVNDGVVLGKWNTGGKVTDEHVFLDRQGTVCVIAGAEVGAVKVWDVANATVRMVLSLKDVTAPVVALSMSLTSGAFVHPVVAVLHKDGNVCVWDLEVESAVVRLDAGIGYPLGGSARHMISLSPDGAKLLLQRGDLMACCTFLCI